MTTRIALVTDIHHGARAGTKRGDRALELLAALPKFVRDVGADCVLELGDRITDVDRERDLVLEGEVAEALFDVPRPVFHINGNHDREFLEIADNEAALGQSLAHEIVDTGGWQMVLWRADTRPVLTEGRSPRFRLDEGDFLWLAETVERATAPLLIASHAPLVAGSQLGNYYFEHNVGFASFPGTERLRRALRAARVPVVCIAGHVHRNAITTVDGFAHLTQQSLTESVTTGGQPANALGVLQLEDDVYWRVHGEDPFECCLRPGTYRGRAPLDPF